MGFWDSFLSHFFLEQVMKVLPKVVKRIRSSLKTKAQRRDEKLRECLGVLYQYINDEDPFIKRAEQGLEIIKQQQKNIPSADKLLDHAYKEIERAKMRVAQRIIYGLDKVLPYETRLSLDLIEPKLRTAKICNSLDLIIGAKTRVFKDKKKLSLVNDLIERLKREAEQEEKEREKKKVWKWVGVVSRILFLSITFGALLWCYLLKNGG